MRFYWLILSKTLGPIRTQNMGSLLMKLSQSNFNLRPPDCYLVRSYLIATVLYSTLQGLIIGTEKRQMLVLRHF